MRRKSPPVLTPLLLTLVLLHQAPAAPEEPITVLIAPPDTAGVPGHVVEFAQEHVAEQARSKGFTVIRMKDFLKKLPSAKRRSLLRCKRTELRCLIALGEAAKSEVVMVAELLQRMDGYRVGTKIYKTADGGLVAEHLIPGVREDGMLDALSQSLDTVVPQVIRQLRPSSAPPDEATPKPPDEVTPKPSKPEAPTPAPKPNLRRWAWVPAAGGAAFAGAGTYFLLQARSHYTKLDSGGTLDDPHRDAAQIVKDGQSAQNLSRITFGIGAAGLVTAAVFYLFPGDEKPVQPTVTVGPGGGMVGLVGTWP